MGWIGRWVRWLGGQSTVEAEELPRLLDLSPPDGVVGRLPVKGVVSRPNPKSPEFARFEGWQGGQTPAQIDRPRRFRAACPALRGRVAVVSIFVGRDGIAWSEVEISKVHRALERAGLWIEREAARWGVALNVDLADTYLEVLADDDPDEERPIEYVPEFEYQTLRDPDAERENLVLLSRLAVGLGFADAADLIERFGSRIEADYRVWLVHQRRGGQSIAIPADLSELPGATMAVCYAREEDFQGPLSGPPTPDPVTYTHEFLHLFGAMDKYGTPLEDHPRGLVTERDIMGLWVESLSRLRVDPLTARELGWSDPATGPTQTPANPRFGDQRGDQCEAPRPGDEPERGA